MFVRAHAYAVVPFQKLDAGQRSLFVPVHLDQPCEKGVRFDRRVILS